MSLQQRDSSRATIGPEARRLGKELALVDGKLALPQAAFVRWRQEHRKLDPATRKARATELIAFAITLQQEVAGIAATAIAQLYVLAAELLESYPERSSPHAKGTRRPAVFLE
ncbi:MAG: hypothetical protein HY901_02550 [Deltaproteobacteria bacterium]|nr:hypothetical protein [Deltaproteobacteria bacterium]